MGSFVFIVVLLPTIEFIFVVSTFLADDDDGDDDDGNDFKEEEGRININGDDSGDDCCVLLLPIVLLIVADVHASATMIEHAEVFVLTMIAAVETMTARRRKVIICVIFIFFVFILFVLSKIHGLGCNSDDNDKDGLILMLQSIAFMGS